MGSAGERGECNPGSGANRAAAKGKALPGGDAELSLNRIVDLIRPVVRVQAEAQFDYAALFSHRSIQKRDVDFFHLLPGKLAAESAMSLCGQGQDHQAGGGHIQAMHSRLGDSLGKFRFQTLDRRVLFIRSASGYGQQSTRFIHHCQFLIGKNNLQLFFHKRTSPYSFSDFSDFSDDPIPQSIKPRIG